MAAANSNSASTIRCFNPNCGQEFRAEENHSSACQYHSTPPVFRNGVKLWSCCNKESWDWEDFLAIPGCCVGFHSNEKPIDVNKNPPAENAPAPIRSAAPVPISAATTNEKSLGNTKESTNEKKHVLILEGGKLQCINKGCLQQYEESENTDTSCRYHSGDAIFRDTRKSWSCCKASSYDWDGFLSIPPCATGPHVPKMA